MIPGNYNIQLLANNTYRNTITWSSAATTDPTGRTPGSPINLTGCSAVLNMFLPNMNPVVPYYSINSTTATSNGGLLTLGGTAGTIAIYIPAADTPSITNGTYTLTVTLANGDINTILTGQVEVISI